MRNPREDIKQIIKANILYTTPYLSDCILNEYEILHKFYDRDIGVSHHGTTCINLYEIHKNYKIPVVEKHFFLGDEIRWKGAVYRDCLHSFIPKMFEDLAKRLK